MPAMSNFILESVIGLHKQRTERIQCTSLLGVLLNSRSSTRLFRRMHPACEHRRGAVRVH